MTDADKKVAATRMREDVSQEILRLDKAYPDKIVVIVLAQVADDGAVLVMPASNVLPSIACAAMRIAHRHMETTSFIPICHEPDDMKDA